MDKQYDVTVLVTTYNPDWESLRKTICSAICQKGIQFQIVVTDDGSEHNFFDEITVLFSESGFTDYILVFGEKNEGTCRNELKGLLQSEGKYVKSISPGDYLFDENTLHDWYAFALANNAKVSFGNAIYYCSVGEQVQVIEAIRQPQNVDVYMKNKTSFKARYLNYIFLDDAVLGANFLVERTIYYEYLEKMLSFLKYAEDMVYRAMILDNVQISYFEKNVVWYECESGISNSNNDKWIRALATEKKNTHRYIGMSNKAVGIDRIRIRIGTQFLLKSRFDFLKYFLFPELIRWKIIKNRKKAFTSYADTDFISAL